MEENKNGFEMNQNFNQENEKAVKTKKKSKVVPVLVIVILILLLALALCIGNMYAMTKDYGSVFAMIGNIAAGEEKENEKENEIDNIVENNEDEKEIGNEVEKNEDIKENISNNFKDQSLSDKEAQKIIQSFRNIMASNEAHTTGMLSIKEISLVTEEEFMQIHNDNRLNRDNEGYMKTDLKYSKLENKLLEYMTKELIERDIHGYKDVNGYLWVADMGASGYSYKIDNVKVVESFENKIVYEVSETQQWIDSNETYTRKYELTKNENGKYVVSNWGWQMEVKESLQNYLDLAGVYEGSPFSLLVKLNLLKAEDIKNFGVDTDSEGFVKTNIKYSDYKEAMLNYVSESWFNEKFTALYREKSGYLYYYNGGATGIQTKVEKIGKYSDGAYNATVYNIDFDGNKTDIYNIKFNVEYNEKYVISYYE